MNRCPVCNTAGTNPLHPMAGLADFIGFDCPRCGKFLLSGTVAGILPDLIQHHAINASRLSHALRVSFDATQKPRRIVDAELQPYREDLSYISPQQQLDNLILWIGQNQGPPHRWVKAVAPSLAARAGAAIDWDTSSERGLTWIIKEYENANLFAWRRGNGSAEYQLKPEGWKYFSELTHRTVHSKNAFMAMQFGDPQLDNVLRSCFQPAAVRAGFTLQPLNERPEAGLIDNQIRAAVRAARFVVADLTHANKGAYFEAGFAEGLGLPVIYTCRTDVFQAANPNERPHFDTNHMQTILWDPEKLGDAGTQLTATIRNTLPADAKLED